MTERTQTSTDRPRGDGRDLDGRPAATVADVTMHPPLRVGRGTSLREVAGAMEDARVSCAVVGTDPPWVVTEHDLAGALAAGCAPDAPVGQVATHTPVWVTPSSTVRDAVELMVAHGIRHLLVLAPDGGLHGVLGLREATAVLLAATPPT